MVAIDVKGTVVHVPFQEAIELKWDATKKTFQKEEAKALTMEPGLHRVDEISFIVTHGFDAYLVLYKHSTGTGSCSCQEFANILRFKNTPCSHLITIRNALISSDSSKIEEADLNRKVMMEKAIAQYTETMPNQTVCIECHKDVSEEQARKTEEFFGKDQVYCEECHKKMVDRMKSNTQKVDEALKEATGKGIDGTGKDQPGAAKEQPTPAPTSPEEPGITLDQPQPSQSKVDEPRVTQDQPTPAQTSQEDQKVTQEQPGSTEISPDQPGTGKDQPTPAQINPEKPGVTQDQPGATQDQPGETQTVQYECTIGEILDIDPTEFMEAEANIKTITDLIDFVVGDDVIEIFGDTGTGKSKVCMQLARMYIEQGKKVFYLDTERNLSPRDQVKMNGVIYKYSPVLNEIDNIVQHLPDVDVVIIDSIGFPVLTKYARLQLNEKGNALLQLIAIVGTLKEWAYNNHGLVIFTNQPESEFAKEKGHILRPFGDKTQFAAKEIWKITLSDANKTSAGTKPTLISFRSRMYPYKKVMAKVLIDNTGVTITPTL